MLKVCESNLSLYPTTYEVRLIKLYKGLNKGRFEIIKIE